jgi:hypothetical protein
MKKVGVTDVSLGSLDRIDITAITRHAMLLRTILRPTDGFGGLNSTPLTDPFAPESTARSTHRPALPEEDGGSSQIRTVRSWEHEARREP